MPLANYESDLQFLFSRNSYQNHKVIQTQLVIIVVVWKLNCCVIILLTLIPTESEITLKFHKQLS
ncbi:unnamed protein product [Moneuplotes crassus]|uniref:Uncharacterized protein n=1 Tax=Euplotes crassus TaxID=5936 RepID=A0AAD1Y259_EUPCR|nr:unnamed protein product [Moneuplotes crassus]